MRFFVALLLTYILAASAAHAFAAETRPVLLLFETAAASGADKQLAASATRALRNYLKDTMRVDPVIFDRESPTVQRAVLEKKLNADDIASYSNQGQRLHVAQVLGFQYAAVGEVGVVESKVEVKLWIARVKGNSKDRWESTAISTAGGLGLQDLDNAMQSAASAVVTDISRRAFADLPVIRETGPITGLESTTIAVPEQPAGPSANDYAAKAEESIKLGNLAVAIQELQRAINADPTNPELRLKLADVYARKGMYGEANSALGAAVMIGASAESVEAVRKRIESLQKGPEPVASEAEVLQAQPGQAVAVPKATLSESPNSKVSQNGPNTPAAAAVAKMIAGDRLWAKGETDAAADAYREAITLNPADYRGYERLAVVNASMGLFNEARSAMERLRSLQPDAAAQTIANRYEMFRKAFDNHFAALLRKYDADSGEYARKKITRETYYNSIKGMAMRLESMAKFLDVLPVPAEKEPANLHRGLACGLMIQAAASLLDYLESNNSKSKRNAAVFVEQAKKEFESSARREANKVIIEKQP